MTEGRTLRVLVFGAGPLGSLFASRLVDAGHDVTVLARGKRLEDIKQHGIVLQDDVSGCLTTTRVNTTDSLNPDDYYDLIMVVMRFNQALQILPVLSANRATQNILFMMNNALGPKPMIDAVGAERAMLGFPLPGGERNGHIMKIMHLNSKMEWTIPIGDADGKIRPRTRMIAAELGALQGYKTQLRKDMDSWLKFHAALLMPGFAPALYATGLDLERFARTRNAQVLAVRAMRESLNALVKCGYRETPAAVKLIRFIPEPLMIGLFTLLSKFFRREMQTGAVGHAAAARDELKTITDDLRRLWKEKGITNPSVEMLYKYFDPETPLMEDGASGIKPKWAELVFPLVFGALAVQQIVYLIIKLRSRRRCSKCC
ncbi:2-dehydropantoate 2-reductase [Chitinispirillum alkaliphilum]|nr:2-dehydropantoate 2-reductase [Chitinispirillum alkaliphilum]